MLTCSHHLSYIKAVMTNIVFVEVVSLPVMFHVRVKILVKLFSTSFFLLYLANYSFTLLPQDMVLEDVTEL